MKDLVIGHARFVMQSADAGDARTCLLSETTTGRLPIRFVYLAASRSDAIRAQSIVAKWNLRVHFAADLSEALLLLKVTGAKVLMVDHLFASGTWYGALRAVSEHCPDTALIVAVPLRFAQAWEEMIPAGAYEVVLKPLTLGEIVPILHNADSYARGLLSDQARSAREKAVLAAIHSRTPACAHHRCPGSGAHDEAPKRSRALTTKALLLLRTGWSFLRKAFH